MSWPERGGVAVMRTVMFVAVVFLLFGPTSSDAATLFSSAVRLVQEEGRPTIYGIVEGKKYRFRTPAILASYAYQKRVEVVPAGSVRWPDVALVRSTLGPRVYLLAPRGQKLWAPGESLAESGYDADEAVVLSHFDIRAYRNAQLVRTAADPAVYYLNYEAFTRSPFVRADDFVASGFAWEDVVVAPPAVIAAFTLAPAVVPGTIRPSEPVAPVDGPTVALSSVTSAAVTIPSGTTRNRVWDIDLAASKGTVSVRSLKITKTGFVRDVDVREVVLVDDEGFRLTNPQRFVENVVTFSLNTPLVIPSGEVRRVSVLLGISADFSENLSTMSLRLNAASDVGSSGGVSGTYPLVSPTATIVKTSGVVGRLSVDSVEISANSRDVVIGAADVPLNTFAFTVSGAREDVIIDSLVFTALGGTASNFARYEVVDERNKVLSAKVQTSGAQVVVDFGKTGLRVPFGTTTTYTLRADVVDGENQSTQFVILNDYDIVARGSQASYTIPALAGPSQGGFPVGNRGSGSFNAVRLQPGQVIVSANTASPSTAITSGARQAVLGTFDIRALGQPRQLDRLTIAIASRGPTPIDGSVGLRVKGGSVAGTIDSLQVTNKAGQFSLAVPPVIASGKTVTIEIIGSVSEAALATDGYTVSLSQFEFTVPGGGDRVVYASTITASERLVQELVLLVRLDPKFVAPVAVGGKTGVKVGRFLFRSGAGEKITIEQVTIAVTGTTAGTFSDGFTNLKFGGKSIAAPTGSPYTFTLNSSVNAASEVGFDLVVDTSTLVNGKTIQFTIQRVLATGATSKGGVAVNLETASTPSVTFQGTSVAFRSEAVPGGVVARAKGVLIGSFSVTASGVEDIGITNVVLGGAPGSASLAVNRGYRNLRLVNATTKSSVSSTVASPVGGEGGNLMSSGPTVKAGQTVVVNVLVDAELATESEMIQMQVTSVKTKGKTTGLPATVSGLPLVLERVQF